MGLVDLTGSRCIINTEQRSLLFGFVANSTIVLQHKMTTSNLITSVTRAITHNKTINAGDMPHYTIQAEIFSVESAPANSGLHGLTSFNMPKRARDKMSDAKGF